jgi:hypothetical protein
MKKNIILASFAIAFSISFIFTLHSQNLPEKNPGKNFECRINVGGDRWIDAQGREWLPDKIYRDGYGYLGLSSTFTSDEAISGTDNQHIYQSERYQLYGYRVDVPNGDYEIILHFAEIYHDRPGARIMNIKIEDKPVLNGLDIYDRVGKNAALQLAFNTKDLNIPIMDERIDITLESQLDDTKLSALEVIQLANQPSLLKIEPANLDFGSAINSLPITISNLGNRESEWRIKTADLPDWIFVPEATAGTIVPEAKTNVIIQVNRAGMSSGIHIDSLTISATDFEEKIPATIIVAGASKLSLLTSVLDFKDNFCNLPCLLTNSGGNGLNWSIETNKLPSWIERIYPVSGTLDIADTTFINLTISRKKLTSGSHSSILAIQSETGIENVSLKISVPQEQSHHLFVDADVVGAKNGKSWEDAFTRIQDAIAIAKPLAVNEIVEIWVAEGIYFENNLHVPSSVQLYGGFVGNETTRSERIDSWSHPTAVDGEKKGRCFECEHRTVIDGFIIQNGRDWTSGDGKGAAILAYDNEVQIRNNLIQNNVDSWAGAVFIDGFETSKNVSGFSPLIENNVLINNFSIYCAAAIEMRGSRAVVRNNTIVNNQGFGLEIQPLLGQLPGIIYGILYNNIITQNFRLEQNDVWGEARKVTNYSFVGHRWSLNGEFGTYDFGMENIFGDVSGKKPGFINAENNNFRLRSDSPCIDSGDPKNSPDPDGTPPDLGAFPFNQRQPEIKISPQNITFNPRTNEQEITIFAYGSKPIFWRVANDSPAKITISAKPISGFLQNGERTKVKITVNRGNLMDGNYDAHLAFMTSSQSLVANLSILVNSSMPEIKLSPPQIEIEAKLDGPSPEPKQVQIKNLGFGNFSWTAKKKLNANWLQFNPTSGKDGDNLTLQYDLSRLHFGDYHEIIQIDAPGTINKPVDLPVTIKMRPGKFIYEVEAEQSSSLPNTGWNAVTNDGAKCIQSASTNVELPDEATRIDYEFDVPEGVEFVYVFAELDVNQSRENDSFWVQMNGYDLCPWDYIYSPRDGWFRSWIYHKLRDERHMFVLIPGKNTLSLFSRERGGLINWFVITNDPDINIDTYQFGTKQNKLGK